MERLMALILQDTMNQSNTLSNNLRDGIINGHKRFLEHMGDEIHDVLHALDDMNVGEAKGRLYYILDRFEENIRGESRLLSENQREADNGL
jgi:hypothetical protein